jgi:acetyl-CoA acyltransferase 1
MSSNQRLQRILSHINQSSQIITPNQTSAPQKSPDDVVIVCALRTPLCKAKRGGFKDTHPTDLLAAVLKAILDKSKLKADEIDDIQVGTAISPGGGATQARIAMFLAGFTEKTSITTCNRQCSSGLQALANLAGSIKSGYVNIGIAAGFESMSMNAMEASLGELNEKTFSNDFAKDCLLPMGITSENVAEQFGVTRKEQDTFASESYFKAETAQKEGLYNDEIIPVHTVLKNDNGETKNVVIDKDDGIRPGTTYENLAKLKPSFKQNGTSTAGNSSQVSDGAGAVLVMKRSEAMSRGLPILGRFLSYAVAGVPPSVMGIGPAFSIPIAVKRAGLRVEDIDIYELNEAFASQALYCMKKLNIPREKVNPLGGAIALGHPLGCTGARQIGTLLHNLRRKRQRFGVVTMCIGTGMGASGVFEAEF